MKTTQAGRKRLLMETHRNRIRLLDILRGFAVLGTLGTNIWIFAHLGDLGSITTWNLQGWWETNDLIRMFVLFLVNGKLLGLLTIMFGVGVELKYRQAFEAEKRGRVFIFGHLSFLFSEGFLHFVFVMEYDILMSYGVTAVIVAFIIKGEIVRFTGRCGDSEAFTLLSFCRFCYSACLAQICRLGAFRK